MKIIVMDDGGGDRDDRGDDSSRSNVHLLTPWVHCSLTHPLGTLVTHSPPRYIVHSLTPWVGGSCSVADANAGSHSSWPHHQQTNQHGQI